MTNGARLPRWARRLAAEWERTVLAALALVLVAVLVLGLLAVLTGAGGAGRSGTGHGTFRDRFQPGAFDFLKPWAWQASAVSPFIPLVERPKPVPRDPGPGPDDDAAGTDLGHQTPPTDGAGQVQGRATPIATIFYNGYVRTGTGAELAFMTIRRAGGRTPEILPVSAAAAGCQIVRFSPERLVIRVGDREFEIAKGTQIALP